MTNKHLSNSDGASPSHIIIVSNFYLASLAIMKARKRQKCFHLLHVILQKRLEVSLVAKVEQAQEGLLELISGNFQSVIVGLSG